jgi:hypothetical protein
MTMIFPHIEEVAAESLARSGYARLDPNFFGGRDVELRAARDAFAESCRDVPRDEHAGDHNRYRRYGTFVLLPWSWTLEAIPSQWDPEDGRFVARYFQSSAINPEHGGTQRSFAPLTKAQTENVFLRAAIMTSFRSLRWSLTYQPVAVGCHIIKLVAETAAPGISSPDLIHRDGEPYTVAALIERTGVVGGENLITIPGVANLHPSEVLPTAILERFTLERPWDGWVVNDEKVAHYVYPVHVAPGNTRGSRTILLIDFTPMAPDLAK